MRHFSSSRFYKYFTVLIVTACLATICGQYINMPVANANPSHIVFIENSWDEALKQAALQNKYIFVDCYATWCGPCMMLKNNTFTNSKAADFYNANFINVSLDMEKGRGPELAQKWQLRAYPTLIIFDSKGKPVLGTVGFINASELIRFGREALKK